MGIGRGVVADTQQATHNSPVRVVVMFPRNVTPRRSLLGVFGFRNLVLVRPENEVDVK